MHKHNLDSYPEKCLMLSDDSLVEDVDSIRMSNVRALLTSRAINTKQLSLVATLAAVYALGSFLPGFPMIGVPGSKIDVVRSLEMGYGLILGPVFGPLTAFLGAIVGKTLTGGGVGLFFTPLAPVSAFMASALSRREVFKIRGWALAAALLSVLIVGWYGTRTGRAAPFYPVLHLIGLGIILGFRGKIADYIHGGDEGRLTWGVALCSFPSTMAGHMLGNLIFISLFGPDPLFFMSILPVSTAERIALTILSTVIATPLILIVRNIFPDLVERV